jgi:hypothetical protein
MTNWKSANSIKTKNRLNWLPIRMKRSTVEIIIFCSFLLVTLLSLKLAFGLAGSLQNLENDTINVQSYRTQLEDFIMKSNFTSSLSQYYTEEELEENRNRTAKQLPRLSIQQLEAVANATKNNGNTFRILAEAENEGQGSAYDTLKSCVINPNLC